MRGSCNARRGQAVRVTPIQRSSDPLTQRPMCRSQCSYVGPRSYPHPSMLGWLFPRFPMAVPNLPPPIAAPFSLCSTTTVKRVDQRTRPEGLFVRLWEPPRSHLPGLPSSSSCHSAGFVPSPQPVEPFAYVPGFKERECYASQSHLPASTRHLLPAFCHHHPVSLWF